MTVEVIEQTGHLVECLLIAVDVSHGQHVLPFPIEVKGIAVADQRRVGIDLEGTCCPHHVARHSNGDAQTIFFEFDESFRLCADVSGRKHAIRVCHVVPKGLYFEVDGLSRRQRQHIGVLECDPLLHQICQLLLRARHIRSDHILELNRTVIVQRKRVFHGQRPLRPALAFEELFDVLPSLGICLVLGASEVLCRSRETGEQTCNRQEGCVKYPFHFRRIGDCSSCKNTANCAKHKIYSQKK